MSYRLGVDVGGTFTDLLLINEDSGETHTAKVPSTPEDSSIGVLNGIARICDESGINPADVTRVMHGTTVATNAVLTGRGACVGLVTTSGYEHTLQVARSFCPGGLGGWVTFVKKPLLAPLELTIGASERIGANGEVITELDEAALREDLETLKAKGGIEALTICFINAYINGAHEARAAAISREVFGDVPISISSEVVPEMQEYERTETTVVNSYVKPEVARYVRNMQSSLAERLGSETQLSILRSDGGLASGRAAAEAPVNLGRWCRRRHVLLQQGGIQQHPDIRYGRHVHRRGIDPERTRPGATRNLRRRREGACTLSRRAYRRRRGRFHCLCSGTHPGTSGRPRVGGRRAGACLLSERR
jgi:N-methylhydantoinase A